MTEPSPLPDRLEKAMNHAADWFVADMRKEGFECATHFGMWLGKPMPRVEISVLSNPPPRLTARQMLPMVAQGARFLPQEGSSGVQTVPLLAEAEYWEWDMSMVFVHKTIVFEYPNPHEENQP